MQEHEILMLMLLINLFEVSKDMYILVKYFQENTYPVAVDVLLPKEWKR